MGDAGYIVSHGRRYCQCSVAVLEMAEAGFKAAGRIPKTASIHDYVTQGGYRAGATAASKGSHDEGGVHDVSYSLVDSDADQRIWDQAGAVGCRRRSWEFTTTKTPDHGHIIAVGCPHLAEFAADQLAEIRAGGDGMAGSRKWTGPTPSFTPWRTRYAAFEAQQEEDDMAMTPTERAALIADIAEASRARIFEQRMTGPEIDPARKPTLHDYLVQTLPARTAAAVHGQWLGSSGPTIGIAVQSTYGLVRELADRAGVDIDEAALAAAVVSEIAPQLVAAIVAKLDGISGVDPAALAAEIVAELGSKLAA